MAVLPLFHLNALFYSVCGTVAAGASLVLVPKFSASTLLAGRRRDRRDRDQHHRRGRLRSSRSGRAASSCRTSCARSTAAPIVGRGRARLARGVRRAGDARGLRHDRDPGRVQQPVPRRGARRDASSAASASRRAIRTTRCRSPSCASSTTTDATCPTGEMGELVVRTPIVMQGLLPRSRRRPQAAFRDGWFLTGDLVRRDADGYFWFVARKKDIIRRRGENISGAELDRVIGQHPAVAEAAAIAVPAKLGEDEILVAVVKRPGEQVTAAGDRRRGAARGSPRTSSRATSCSWTSCRTRRPTAWRSSG